MMSVSLVSDRNVSICASQESIMHYLSKHTPSRHIHDVWKPTGAIEVTHPLEASKGVCVGQRVNCRGLDFEESYPEGGDSSVLPMKGGMILFLPPNTKKINMFCI